MESVLAILITGGAGYIGSHTALYLKEQGMDVVIVDDLSSGHREAVLNTPFYEGRIHDEDLLGKIFEQHKIDAVIHFAASSLVSESVSSPLKYYENNVIGTYHLLKKMAQYDVQNIVFSSSAAIYGNVQRLPIVEEDTPHPSNPYGETKLVVERMLQWAESAYGIKSVCLRYFNAAGADPLGRIGEDHSPETHLIPVVLQAALGIREFVSVFGDDYPTKDGTCIRDYIHVMDLAAAHYLSIKYLFQSKKSEIFNLGNGQGFSVKEVIDTCQEVTGKKIRVKLVGRRAGDPAQLIASAEKAKTKLGWKPKYPTLHEIIQHAWNWHKNHPNGYGESKN